MWLRQIEFEINRLVVAHHFRIVIRIGELADVHEQRLVVHLECGEHAGYIRHVNIGRFEGVLRLGAE